MAKRINELGTRHDMVQRLDNHLGKGVRGGTTFPIDQNDWTFCITFDDVLKTTCNKVGQSGFHVTSGFTVDLETSTSAIKLSGLSGAHTYIDSFYDSNNIHGDGANVQWTRFSSKTDDGTATYHLAFQAGQKDLWRSKVIGSPVLEKLDFGTTDITGLENRVTVLENKQHVGVAGVHVAEEPPATTTNGALWWDTNTASMYVFDSDAWVVTNPGGAGGGSGTGDCGEIVYVEQTEIYRAENSKNEPKNGTWYPTSSNPDTANLGATVNMHGETPGMEISSTTAAQIAALNIPTTASGLIITAYGKTDGYTSTSGDVQMYIKSAKVPRRRCTHAYADNNMGSGSSYTTFMIPYTPDIELSSLIRGSGTGGSNMKETAVFYIEGYITGCAVGGGSGGGSGGGEMYESVETAIPVTNTEVTFNHNLSKKPDRISYKLVCKTAEWGYEVGDEIHYSGSYVHAGGWATFTADDSKIKMSVYMNNVTTGPWYVDNRGTPNSSQYITNDKWKIVVHAFAETSGTGSGGIFSFSSDEITTEGPYTLNYPPEWTGGRPDMVMVSTRYPGSDNQSQVWFQTVSWNESSVTIYAQGQHNSTFSSQPVIADLALVKNN